MGVKFNLEAFRKVMLGDRVDRATANITTGLNLYTVAGGRVAVTLIIGEVTTIIETKTVNFKLTATPTTGTAADMCADLDISADEAGSIYTISGTPADAMRRGESGCVVMQNDPSIVAIGTIDATIGATHTGSIKLALFYVPIDEGAYVEAA